MLTLVSKDSVKISDHFDVLCVLIACMVLEIINQMSQARTRRSTFPQHLCMKVVSQLSQPRNLCMKKSASGGWQQVAMLPTI